MSIQIKKLQKLFCGPCKPANKLQAECCNPLNKTARFRVNCLKMISVLLAAIMLSCAVPSIGQAGPGQGTVFRPS